MLPTSAKIAVFMMLSFSAIIFFACAVKHSTVIEHPYEAVTAHKCSNCHNDGRVVHICSNCHDDERASLNHTSDYTVRHKFYGAQKNRLCNTCHKESFCSDCHANKEEIKPSDKFKDSPERVLPHRGDYLTQHKIDGRINPVPCLRCHGRNNNARCRVCHR